jgi:hypothetical protein
MDTLSIQTIHPDYPDIPSCLLADQLLVQTTIDWTFKVIDDVPKVHVEARVEQTAISMPPVLLIRLGREKVVDGVASKLRTRVHIDPVIDIAGMLPEGAPKADGVYHLTAVVAHSGTSLTSGHYAALVAGVDGGAQMQWCDDSSVMPWSIAGLNASTSWDAYIVAYVRNSLPHAPVAASSPTPVAAPPPPPVLAPPTVPPTLPPTVPPTLPPQSKVSPATKAQPAAKAQPATKAQPAAKAQPTTISATEPSAAVAKQPAAECRCGESREAHGADQWTVTCSKCTKTVIGRCANTPREDRSKVETDFLCWECARAVGVRQMPRPQPAPPQQEQQQQQQQQQPVQMAQAQTHVQLAQCGRLFRCGQATRPSLAALKGDALLDLVVYDDPPKRVDTGKTAAVRQRHRVILRQLKAELAELQPRFRATQLSSVIVTMMRERATVRRWKAATLHREMANVAGALVDLPLYTNSPVGFQLQESAEFRDAMRSSQMRANEDQVGSQPACTFSEVRLAIKNAPDVATKIALILTWICAGRVGDVLKVARPEIVLAPDFLTSGNLRITFCRGKGAKFAQPYTVPTLCPPVWRQLLVRYLQTLAPTNWLFPGGPPVFGPLASMALRTVNPEYTVRSIRRGALQTMADNNVPFPTLMIFSGHKREDTLLRYLDWGAKAARRAQEARAAALYLVA